MKVRKNITIGPKMWESLQELAKKEESSASELIREALKDLFIKRLATPTSYNPTTDRFD